MRTLALPHLQTERLILRLAEPADIPALREFHIANAEHLAPTAPLRPPDFLTSAFWERDVARSQEAFLLGRSARLSLFRRDAPGTVIGAFNFNNIVREAAQYADVGLALDRDHEGKGLMTEAGHAAISYAFGDLALHRLNACYLPTNARSARLLRRLGFVVEGYRRAFLRIQGRWQDQVLVGRINPDWRPLQNHQPS
jgi:[ribosomal protein S5]-alanine N-acetyltransferase